MRFLMLVPKSLDPVARSRWMPLPEPRPAEAIAKLLDRENAEKESSKPADASTAPGSTNAADTAGPANDGASKPAEAAAPVVQASTEQTIAAEAVPLPEPRPNITPHVETRRFRHHHPYRLGR
jgi:membrane-bound lytic murein transglycosylase A